MALVEGAGVCKFVPPEKRLTPKASPFPAGFRVSLRGMSLWTGVDSHISHLRSPSFCCWTWERCSNSMSLSPRGGGGQPLSSLGRVCLRSAGGLWPCPRSPYMILTALVGATDDPHVFLSGLLMPSRGASCKPWWGKRRRKAVSGGLLRPKDSCGKESRHSPQAWWVLLIHGSGHRHFLGNITVCTCFFSPGAIPNTSSSFMLTRRRVDLPAVPSQQRGNFSWSWPHRTWGLIESLIGGSYIIINPL